MSAFIMVASVPAPVIKTFYMDLCGSLCLAFGLNACHKSPWHPMEGIALTWCSSSLSFCSGNKAPLKKRPHKNGANSELFVFSGLTSRKTTDSFIL